MTELTTQLFLDVKKFEKYQELLKEQVHLNRQSLVDSSKFPNTRIYNRLLSILATKPDGLTSTTLVMKCDFRASEMQDAIAALLDSDLITKTDISETECKVQLNSKGQEAVKKLNENRDKVVEDAYGSLSQDEQKQLDQLIIKLIKEYEGRDVNYTALSELI